MRGRLAPVLRASRRSLLAHRGRLALTFLSVVLGTAFIAGSLLLTSSLERSFDEIVDAGVSGVDVALVGSISSPQGVPFAVIDEVRSWPEVRAVNVIGDGPGLPTGTRSAGASGIIVVGPDGTPLQAGSSGAHPFAAYPFRELVGPVPQLIDGRWPITDDEVMVNAAAARRAGLEVGDELLVISPRERLPVRLTGVYESPRETAGWIGVMFTPETYLGSFTDGEHASQVVISVHPGSDPMEVRNRLGLTYRELTPLLPEQIVERLADDRLQQLEFIRYILVIFGAVALFIGSLNIVNTFAMVVGQRTREFALLRSIGVSTVQVAASVILEAALVGLAGSVVGVLAAAALVAVLFGVFRATDSDLAALPLAWPVEAFVVPLFFGVLVTLLAALAPARRAALLPPVQSFDLADARSSRLPVLKLLGAGAAAAAGTAVLFGAALITSLNNRVLSVDLRLSLVALGVVLGLWSLVLAGPVLVAAVGNTFGRVLTAPLGTVGTLARQNAVRNPRRSAMSALALALGVGLVAGVGTLGASAQASVYGAVRSTVTAPFILDSLGGGSVQGRATTSSGLFLPPEVRDIAADVRGVADAGTLMSVPLQADHWNHRTTTVLDNDFSKFMNLGVTHGAFSDGSAPAAALSAEYSEQNQLRVGDYIPLTIHDGQEENALWIPVTAIYTETALLGHIAVSWAAAEAVLEDASAQVDRRSVFVTSDGSVPDHQLRRNLDAAMAPLLVVQVKSSAEYSSDLGSQINQLLMIVYALVALAVVIAMLGIINTLLLSVAERGSEIGTLRAIGLQRRDIRRIIVTESLIITVHGAVVGVAAGTVAGWAAVRVLAEKGMAVADVPWPHIALMTGASVIVGVVASIIPARRAAAIPPLEAIDR